MQINNNQELNKCLVLRYHHKANKERKANLTKFTLNVKKDPFNLTSA